MTDGKMSNCMPGDRARCIDAAPHKPGVSSSSSPWFSLTTVTEVNAVWPIAVVHASAAPARDMMIRACADGLPTLEGNEAL